MKFDEVRPSIEEVFDHYGARILSGNNWQKAFCPLLDHEDKNASASVNVELGKWNCFSCDKRGDVFDIIIENEVTCAGPADAIKFAKANFAGGGGAVRPERGRSGLVPPGARPKPRAGNFTPPWKRV